MGQLSRKNYFHHSQRLVEKFIEELQFEEILKPELQDCGEYKLTVHEKICYRFAGCVREWGNLCLRPGTLRKWCEDQEVSEISVLTFIKEIQSFCQMDDQTLSLFLEEAQKTLFSDIAHAREVQDLKISELTEMDYLSVDQLLPGHPKLLLNKGRVGWGVKDLENYAPESRGAFQLRWVAARSSNILMGTSEQVDNLALLNHSLSEEEKKHIFDQISSLGEKITDFFIFPVHPWQWDQHIQFLYCEDLAMGKLIDLGEMGVEYTPQVSLRTLSQTQKRKNLDIKLSVSILNTSCVRGVSPKYIETGHNVSKGLREIVARDEFLSSHRLLVAGEVAAVSCPLSSHRGIADAPYRYQEYLGAIWRESVDSQLEVGEKAYPTAALIYSQGDGSFAGNLIEKSGKSVNEWLKKYFQHVVLPLYHLQLHYGVGLVSHGQNTIVVLRENAPAGLIIKDFHGDLRLSKDSSVADDEDFQSLERLPSEYLIHDLITGHFVTVLRYFSRTLHETCKLDEKKFYGILAQEIKDYLAQWGREEVIPEKMNLLRKSFEKVLVNKVRFVAGYGESNQRLKPLLGGNIENPLFRNLEQG